MQHDIRKEIKEFILSKSFTTNISRIQAYDLVTCEYFCIEFIDFMMKGKNFLVHINLCSSIKYNLNSFRNLE